MHQSFLNLGNIWEYRNGSVICFVRFFIISMSRPYISIYQRSVCYYYITYAFQSESTPYGCLNVKEFLARNRRVIWSLSDNNGIGTHNPLVRKRKLNHLAELVLATRPVCLNGWVFVYELSGCGFESRCCHL